MVNAGSDHVSEERKEKLRKEQKLTRKIGIILLVLAVIFMPVASFIHYGLVGVPAVLAVVGGIMVARSCVHVKYQ